MSLPLIAPSILAADFLHLDREVQWLNKSGIDLLHIDIMDGHFVPNISLGFPVLSAISSVAKVPLDVHLMVTNPEDHILSCKEKGAERISVHVEVCQDIISALQSIRRAKCRAGVAINPSTPLDVLSDAWEWMDHLIIMSVQPGFSGQSFLPGSVEKVEAAVALRNQTRSSAQIVVDGGVDLVNAPTLSNAGADILVIGNAFFGAKNRDTFLSSLKANCI